MATPIALLFPGQGAQKIGMGKEFYETSPDAQTIFSSADAVLKTDLTRTIFEGPPEKLTSTAYAQPAILTCSVAILKAFAAHPKFKRIAIKFCAGLSLGEYSALVAIEALSFEEALRLVERRATFMEEATKLETGGMAAIIGFPKDMLTSICQQTYVQVANYNSPEQTVITGNLDRVKAASEIFKKEGAKSVIPLEVSGAFHSTLMQPAARKFAAVLKGFNIKPPAFPVVCNVDALPHADPETIRKNLALQITSSVRWEQSVRYIAAQGVSEFIEFGPGKVLKGLLRKIDPALKVYNIETPADVEVLPF